MTELELIVEKLGKPSAFIATASNVSNLRKWAILTGLDPVSVHIMPTKDLVNLYHEKHGESKAAPFNMQELTTEIFVRIMNAVNIPGFNVDITREVTRDEVARYIAAPEMRQIYEDAARKVFDTLPPRQIQVTAPGFVGPIVALNHPLMMVGPAGSGKTTIGETIAQLLNLPFYITNAIGDTFELSGFMDGNGIYHGTPFRTAFEFGGVWLADEIDAWSANALLAANSALANGYAAFPDQSRPVNRHPNFRMIATANTFGTGADRVYIGRNELDAASLDRFATMEIDYDLQLERHLCNGREEWLDYVWRIRKAVEAKKIRHVVSTRAISMGSAALNAGLTRGDVENLYLFKGMSEVDRGKVSRRKDDGIPF